MLFFCLTSLFANLLAYVPLVRRAAQICKPPSQSKKYLRPPLPEKYFLYFQENSFDIFLPCIACYEESAIHRPQNKASYKAQKITVANGITNRYPIIAVSQRIYHTECKRKQCTPYPSMGFVPATFAQIPTCAPRLSGGADNFAGYPSRGRL